MVKNNLKILELDYETSPARGRFFGSIWETNIVHIDEFEQVLTVSWKWHGEKKLNVLGQDDFDGYKPGKLNDKALCQFFSTILSQADYVVAHNGDSFDMKVFNTRLLFHRLPQVPELKTFDTKKLSKGKFHFPSNKLDHIAQFLGIEGKIHHKGIDLWLGCEAGNPEVWRDMKKYNKQDIVVLDDVFSIIMPYVKLPAQFNVVSVATDPCPNPLCGSMNLKKRGTERVAGGLKQRYQCGDCGKWSYGKKLIS